MKSCRLWLRGRELLGDPRSTDEYHLGATAELDSRYWIIISEYPQKIPGVPLKTIAGMGYQLGGEDK